jgi:hypothetical protein
LDATRIADDNDIQGVVVKKLVVVIGLAAAGLGVNLEAQASEYGCKVMLCMANPAGPMAEQQCQPPIQQLLREQAKTPPEPWPTCEEGAPATMQPQVRFYDKCPANTSELGDGVVALQLTSAQYKAMKQNSTGRQLFTSQTTTLNEIQSAMRTGIGEGNSETYATRVAKTCVSKPLGSLDVAEGQGENAVVKTYPVYEGVSFVDAPTSPRVVDVYIDNKLFKSTRY